MKIYKLLKQASETSTFHLLWKMKWRLIVLTSLVQLLSLGPAIYMLQVYDRVLLSYSVPTLVLLSFILILVFIFQALLEWLRGILLLKVSNSITLATLPDLYLYGQNYGGGGTPQVLGDFNVVRGYIVGPGYLSTLEFPWTIFFLGLLFFLDSLLGVFGLVTIVMLVALAYLSDQKSSHHLKEANSATNDSTRILISHSKNIELASILRIAKGMQRAWLRTQNRFLVMNDQLVSLSSAFQQSTKVLRTASQSLILGLAAYLAIDNQLSVGSLIAASVLLGRCLAPIESFTSAWKSYASASEAFERLKPFLLEIAEKKSAQTEIPLPSPSVVASNALLQINGNEKSYLGPLNFDIREGTSVCVVGPSGAGKTSMLRALMSARLPVSGKVLLGGAPVIQHTDLLSRRLVGYCPDSPVFFPGTVAENITGFADETNVDDMVRTAKLLGIHDRILSLPLGYDSQFDGNSVSLSSGELQRLCLARAVYGNKGIVFLDEPYTALDEAGEKILKELILTLRNEGKVIIFTTHRRDYIEVADFVLILAGLKQVRYLPKSEFYQLQGQVKPIRLASQE